MKKDSFAFFLFFIVFTDCHTLSRLEPDDIALRMMLLKTPLSHQENSPLFLVGCEFYHEGI